ncbi:MAG: transglycosylase SLT domain-containing protein [Hydrogenophaga sp.]|uniref:transglycosylase SLT domain-containing protein n=1 Tax=Hydrogenophaga sp. TaxID=1904254 RepID=UPI002579FF30|nr:transglycosylase SLT domain-containing protein [Hydrogenophaga sp.]MBL0946497.1 transglycosylase SLT domain-containing protein [Hydrogenophaga sp.]
MTQDLSTAQRPRRPGARCLGALLLCLSLLAGCASTLPTPSSAPRTDAADSGPAAVSTVRGPSQRLPANVPLSEIAVAPVSAPAVTTLAAPADLWERIRRGLAMNDLDGDLVRQHEQWYLARPDYIQRMTERSSRYLFHIVEEIERRGLPMELALLPFIESAFNPAAVSSARAAGMWQFMPATGASFDLKQNVFRDDRRDVLASTRAALDYLEQLYGRFGDWHLALAAYNWGQGNVNRAITRNQRAGEPTGYLDLNMPAETRHYVPKLQAVKNIVANPQRYGATLPVIGNHPFFDTITVLRDMDVALIARLAEVSEADFRMLNPSLKQPVVMAAGTPTVLLPWDNATTFQRNLQSYNGPLASWTAWVVPHNMSPAEAAERMGMSEAELRSVNNIPPRMRLAAGSSLLVPRNGRLDRDVPAHVADNAALNLQPEVTTRRVVVKARKGDNVARLASRHGVSAVRVAEWNRLSVNSALKAGQSITLQLPQRAAAPAVAKGKAKAPAVQARSGAGKTTAKAGKASATRTAKAAKTTPTTKAAKAAKSTPAKTRVATGNKP